MKQNKAVAPVEVNPRKASGKAILNEARFRVLAAAWGVPYPATPLWRKAMARYLKEHPEFDWRSDFQYSPALMKDRPMWSPEDGDPLGPGYVRPGQPATKHPSPAQLREFIGDGWLSSQNDIIVAVAKRWKVGYSEAMEWVERITADDRARSWGERMRAEIEQQPVTQFRQLNAPFPSPYTGAQVLPPPRIAGWTTGERVEWEREARERERAREREERAAMNKRYFEERQRNRMRGEGW